MSDSSRDGRVENHIAAFNAAVESGDWHTFVERFTTDAVMVFVGVPAGPSAGRAAIAEAYEQQPPTDTLESIGRDSDGVIDRVRSAWSGGGTGTMLIEWSGDLVCRLEVTFDS